MCRETHAVTMHAGKPGPFASWHPGPCFFFPTTFIICRHAQGKRRFETVPHQNAAFKDHQARNLAAAWHYSIARGQPRSQETGRLDYRNFGGRDARSSLPTRDVLVYTKCL